MAHKINLAFVLLLFTQACDSNSSATISSNTNEANKQMAICQITSLEDVPKQMSCLEQNAEAGSVIDQYNLAIAFRDGLNGEFNPGKSILLDEKSSRAKLA